MNYIIDTLMLLLCGIVGLFNAVLLLPGFLTWKVIYALGKHKEYQVRILKNVVMAVGYIVSAVFAVWFAASGFDFTRPAGIGLAAGACILLNLYLVGDFYDNAELE